MSTGGGRGAGGFAARAGAQPKGADPEARGAGGPATSARSPGARFKCPAALRADSCEGRKPAAGRGTGSVRDGGSMEVRVVRAGRAPGPGSAPFAEGRPGGGRRGEIRCAGRATPAWERPGVTQGDRN